MKAVILAGGRGERLAPYTTVLPKPLLPIGDFPILEIVIRQLRSTVSTTSPSAWDIWDRFWRPISERERSGE